ncbi:nuclear mRNA export, poly(A)+RNA binding protein [Malassezia sp. CBS 17886]|nr:nuclear mRNA export, poly(A)+RNA binding protein [Malassezia sp. CBS 17886]
MPKRGQRQPPLVADALRGAGLIDGDERMDEEGAGGRRAQRRRVAREAAAPLAPRPARRAPVNMNSLARPANARGRAPRGRGAGAAARGGRVHADVAPQTNVVQTLRTFLQSRWHAPQQLLNLENMQADAILVEANIRPPGAPGAHKDLGTALWKLSAEMFPTLTTLSLASNGLSSMQPLAALGQYVPQLANLSLERNELRWVRDLDVFAARKHGLGALQELLLVGNPLQQNAVDAGNEDGYRRDVLAKFPGLRILDRKPVSEIEHGFSQLFRGRAARQTGPEAAKVPLRAFPLPMKPGFVDGDAARVVPEFLSLFFARYDQDRALLSAVYSPNARFSFSVNASPPPRARAERLVHTMPGQKDLVFDRYMELGSRNILRSHNTKTLLRTMHHGGAAVVAFLQRLPATTHPLHDASKFLVDAWVLPNVDVNAQTSASEKPDALLFITVHGEYHEAPSQGLRSFDRSFVVAPAASTSDAAQHGWPCTVVSDMLTVRHYSRPAAWAPGPMGAAPKTGEGAAGVVLGAVREPAGAVPGDVREPMAAVPGATPRAGLAPAGVPLPPRLQTQEPLAGLTPEQHALSLQLAAQTNLLYPFAVQCLVENSWVPGQALTNFHALQATQSIPPEAFAK